MVLLLKNHFCYDLFVKEFYTIDFVSVIHCYTLLVFYFVLHVKAMLGDINLSTFTIEIDTFISCQRSILLFSK